MGFPEPVMRITPLALLLLSLFAAAPARAELHITRDHGGYVEDYKAKYKRIRETGQRVIIDGICNSACTLVLGIVPMNKICVTPRASLGFHQAYYDKAFTFGIKVTSLEGTSDLMSYYPELGEGLDPQERWAHDRDEEDQERCRSLEDRRSLSGRLVGRTLFIRRPRKTQQQKPRSLRPGFSIVPMERNQRFDFLAFFFFLGAL